MKEQSENFSHNDKSWNYSSERFEDIEILRYKVPGFNRLSLKEKELLYYLYNAALCGREIFYDQNYKHNLRIKRTLEAIVKTFKGNRDSDDFKKYMVYVKKFWFSNGIHHCYSAKKILPDFSQDYFKFLLENSNVKDFPLGEGETLQHLFKELVPVIFNPEVDAQKINLDKDADVIKTSCNNFYENISQKEVEDFYNDKDRPESEEPVSLGLNSKLVKEDGRITEKVWKIGGMYSDAIEQIGKWLEKSAGAAENENQKAAFIKLAEYYKTGCLSSFDEYNILWLKDKDSVIDTVNGFIEVYGDPLGYKGSFEGIVSIKDFEGTKRINTISKNAQWFEVNSPIDEKFKKKNVNGISGKAINVVVESGDASPSTPIGINLPNANWIREKYGSKSVNLGNIVYAYFMAEPENLVREFAYSEEEVLLAEKFAAHADNIHTDLHEVIGHGSGQILPGVGSPRQTLKNYASTIEETRADLVALYYLPDNKLVELGVMPVFDAAKAGYNKYIRNGLFVQLARIEVGDNLEEAHMRNRQLICKWVCEKGKAENVIEKKIKDGKTFFVINDYLKLRSLFGEMLREVQRITSEGDFEAAKNMVESYGVKIDLELHKEVKERYDKLNIPPYKGFINPVLKPVYKEGKLVDVEIEYPDNFTEQMLYYAEKYSFLPDKN